MIRSDGLTANSFFLLYPIPNLQLFVGHGRGAKFFLKADTLAHSLLLLMRHQGCEQRTRESDQRLEKAKQGKRRVFFVFFCLPWPWLQESDAALTGPVGSGGSDAGCNASARLSFTTRCISAMASWRPCSRSIAWNEREGKERGEDIKKRWRQILLGRTFS